MTRSCRVSGCPARQKKDALRSPDGLDVELRVGCRLGHVGEANVDRALAHVFDHARPVGDPQLDEQVRVAVRDRPDCALTRNIRRIGRGGDAQLSDLQPLGERNLAHEFVEPGDRALAVLQYDLGEQCRRHAPPIEQRHAEVGLKLLQAACQRRLRHAQILGGEAEMAAPRQGLDDLDLPDGVHGIQSELKCDPRLLSPDTINGIGLGSLLHHTFVLRRHESCRSHAL